MFRFSLHKAAFLTVLVLGFVSVGMAQQKEQQRERAFVEGKEWFRAYCAACHGEDARGNGPVARELKEPPPDLTTLAKRNNGKFPEDYVKKVLIHGVAAPAHGSSDMPIGGPVFAGINTRVLTQYLESVQTK
jgi:mono/diheme cytochrome c family protein